MLDLDTTNSKMFSKMVNSLMRSKITQKDLHIFKGQLALAWDLEHMRPMLMNQLQLNHKNKNSKHK